MNNKRIKKNKNEKLSKSIIDFLKTGPKTRQEIWDHLGGAQAVPKSTLSNVTTELKHRGIINDFKPGEQITLQEEQLEYEKLDKSVLNEWLILYAIGSSKNQWVSVSEIVKSYMGICFEERITSAIRKKYYDVDNAEDESKNSAELYEAMYKSADQSIRHYLEKRLVPTGMVEKRKALKHADAIYEYSLTNAAPIIVKASYEQLEEFVRFYHLENVESTSDEIAERIKTLLWGQEASDDKIKFVSGKLNHLQQVSLRRMDELLQIPYKQKKLALITKGNSNKPGLIISVGILFYSSETNEFYILGESKKNIDLIRMSSILEMKATNENNEIFNDEKFHEYLDDMMGIEVSDLTNVRIRFKNENSTRKTIEAIITGRKNAKLEEFNNGKELLYTDQARGVGTLQTILRSLGAKAIVEEPANLRKLMLRTADKIEERYMEDENVSE